jgi:hypothetical protein
MIVPLPKFRYGQVAYVNDNFYVNVRCKVWGVQVMADPDYPKDKQMLVYMCAVKLDGQRITLNASEKSLTPKPIRRADEVGTIGD